MKRILATMLASAMATGAYAADIVATPPPAPVAPFVEPGFDWTGPYIGVQLGYGTADVDRNGYADLPGVFVPGGDPGIDGVLGGVHAGYNHDFGDFVVGVELDYDVTSRRFDDVDAKLDGIGRAKVKAGVAFGRVLPYATAGVAVAHGEVGGDNITEAGYVVGAGIDYAATDNIIVGAEYLYQSFDDIDDTPVDIDGHVIRAKVSWKF